MIRKIALAIIIGAALALALPAYLEWAAADMDPDDVLGQDAR